MSFFRNLLLESQHLVLHEPMPPTAMSDREPLSKLESSLLIIAVALAYLASAKLGLAFAIIDPNTSPFWPPAGIAMAAILLFGYRMTAGIALGALLTTFSLAETSTLAMFVIPVGNTLAATCGAWLLRLRIGHRNPVLSARDAGWFMLLGVALTSGISASLGVAVLKTGTAATWPTWHEVWRTWFIGDSVGILFFTPLIMSWWNGGTRDFKLRQLPEVLLLGGLLTVACRQVFLNDTPPELIVTPQAAMTMPLLIWATFRFHERGATAGAVVVACFTIWGATSGVGPYVRATKPDSVLASMNFIAMLGASSILLTALVSERRQAAVDIKKAEVRSRILFEHSPDAVMVIDPSTDLPLQFNECAPRLVGYTREEFSVKPIMDYLIDREEHEIRTPIRSVLSSEISEYETKYRCKDGRSIDVLVKFSVIDFSQRTAFLMIVHDITIQKRERARLERQVSQRTFELSAVNAALRREIEERERFEEELQKSYDEMEHRVEDRTLALRTANEFLEREITDRKHAEDRAMHLQAQLAHASRVSIMGEMAAGLAHEVQQPLAVIVNFASGCVLRLKNGRNDTDGQIDALKEISDEAIRASEIIRRIRNFIQKRETERQWLKLTDIVADAVHLARFECRQNNVSIQIASSPDLPLVFADRIQITQVLLNLVLNGIEAMTEAGSIDRCLTIQTSTKNLDLAEIAVSDNGPGVPEQLRERIFDQFFTTKSEGLGMGLSISRSIVETHGGRLCVTTRDDHGSVFSLTLPIHHRHETTADA